MDIGVATLVAAVVLAIGQIVTAVVVHKLHKTTNGMRAELEKGQYAAGGRDEKARADAATIAAIAATKGAP